LGNACPRPRAKRQSMSVERQLDAMHGQPLTNGKARKFLWNETYMSVFPDELSSLGGELCFA
jgi:hypothetical protein